jgi:Tol biopolymer transport system component
MRIAVLVLIGVTGALALASSAFSSFPGLAGVIAFDRPGDANVEIYTMNANGSNVHNISNVGGDADGSNVRRLTNDPGVDYFPAPAPRGDSFAFISDRDGTFDIYTTTTGGGPVKRVTDSAVADVWPIWSP